MRTQTNPLVTGPFGVRFYAAAPLRTHDGFKLGALCVADHEPRELSTTEAQILTNLAALVMAQMELRLSVSKVAELEQAERRICEQLRQGGIWVRLKSLFTIRKRQDQRLEICHAHGR
jgi:GAF domain-containing protein